MKLRQLGSRDSTRWEVVVELGLDPKGNRKRARRRFEATGPKTAKKKAAEIEQKLTAVAIAAHRATLAGAVEAWWVIAAPGLEESTRREYRRLIDRRILTSPLATKPLMDLTRGDIRRWYAAIAAEGRTGTPPKLRAILVPALQLAVDDELLSTNPARDVKLPKHETPEWSRLRVADIQALLDAAGRDTVKGRALHFAALTGMRRGEVAGLRWSRVDLINGVLMGDRAVAIAAPERAGDPMRIVDKGTKSGTKRIIELDEETTDLLHDQWEWQGQQAQARGAARARDGYVWSARAPFDRPMRPELLTQWFTRARDAAGLQGMRLHDLRHWHASVMASDIKSVPGASLADVQRRLGHRQLATTLKYLHADEEERRIGHQLASKMKGLLTRRATPELEAGGDIVDAEVVE